MNESNSTCIDPIPRGDLSPWKRLQRELSKLLKPARYWHSASMKKAAGAMVAMSGCDYQIAPDGSISRVTPKRYSSKADRRNQIKARRIAKQEAA